MAFAFPLVLVLSTPGLSQGALAAQHVVAFESTAEPGFTFASVGTAGVATLGLLGVTEPFQVTCIHFTVYDATHILVQAAAVSSSGRKWYFTLYGTGLIQAKATPLPDYGASCWAPRDYYGGQGVGVIL
jgi:hypothetical protein